MFKSRWPQKETYRKGNKIKLLESGEEYFTALEKLIKQATGHIHLQVYIFEPDNTGKRILNSLAAAAKRGVRVFLVVDAFGSNSLTEADVEKIKSAGIHFRKFSPLQPFKGIKTGRRMHHKVFVADGRAALIGGINISDKYRGSSTVPPWLDFAVMIKGPLSTEIEKICQGIWSKKIFRNRPKKKNPSPASSKTLVRVQQHDWIRNKRGIVKSYRMAFRRAGKSITIVGSYFLPGIRLRFLIQKAVRRGVKINLILSDISDVQIAKRATNFLYRWMLEQNIQIYEYAPAVVHGKVAIVDGYWCTVGSYNLNYLSEFGSIETNIDVLDEGFCTNFEQRLQKIIETSCKKITLEDHIKNKSAAGNMLDWASYQLVRLSMRTLYFFTRKDLKNVLE